MVRMQRIKAKGKKSGRCIITPLMLLGFTFAVQLCFFLGYILGTNIAHLGVLETGVAGLRGGGLPKGWHGADDEVWPKPGDWEKYGFYQIRKHFKCSQYAHDHAKPLPTLEDWDVFKKTYQEVVDPNAKFDDPVPSTLGYSFGSDGNPPPYHAKHGERGRGLFATRDIKKGELVHDGTLSEVMFPTGHDWRKYIFALPRNKACDMIDWTWTQKHEGDGQLHVFTAMHIAVLCNGGNNATINASPDSPSSMKEYALRNISQGEEILTDYNVYATKWHEVGL